MGEYAKSTNQPITNQYECTNNEWENTQKIKLN